VTGGLAGREIGHCAGQMFGQEGAGVAFRPPSWREV